MIHAVDLAMADRIDGIVTATFEQGSDESGGLFYMRVIRSCWLRKRAQVAHISCWYLIAMNVSHVTGHIALHEVSDRLTVNLICDTIRLTRDVLIGMGKSDPKVAVCGLNPHAGENGLFGSEDAEIIHPAVEKALSKGWRVDGPLPADTTFLKVYNGLYDGVVAMYHDQGHVPAKLVAFDEAVNVTLGLPIVRASVDHGTAYDIAGKGVAKAVNMLQAIRVGSKLATSSPR